MFYQNSYFGELLMNFSYKTSLHNFRTNLRILLLQVLHLTPGHLRMSRTPKKNVLMSRSRMRNATASFSASSSHRISRELFIKNNENYPILVRNTDYINVLAFLLVGNVGGVINEVGDTLPLPDSFTWILKLDGTHGVILSGTLFFIIRFLLVHCDDTSYDTTYGKVEIYTKMEMSFIKITSILNEVRLMIYIILVCTFYLIFQILLLYCCSIYLLGFLSKFREK